MDCASGGGCKGGSHFGRVRRHHAKQNGLRHHSARIAGRLVDSFHAGRRRHGAFAAELHGRDAQPRSRQDVVAAGALRCGLSARRQDGRPRADGADDPRCSRDALFQHALEALGERLALLVSHERRFLPDVECTARSAGAAERTNVHPQPHRHARRADRGSIPALRRPRQ